MLQAPLPVQDPSVFLTTERAYEGVAQSKLNCAWLHQLWPAFCSNLQSSPLLLPAIPNFLRKIFKNVSKALNVQWNSDVGSHQNKYWTAAFPEQLFTVIMRIPNEHHCFNPPPCTQTAEIPFLSLKLGLVHHSEYNFFSIFSFWKLMQWNITLYWYIPPDSPHPSMIMDYPLVLETNSLHCHKIR